MALETRTLTLSENIAANQSGSPYNTWFGAELIGAPGYNALTFTPTGGHFWFTGEGSDDVSVFSDTGLKLGENPSGDPGYHVHFEQPNGSPAFRVWVTLTYT